jgi:hypothetical protein
LTLSYLSIHKLLNDISKKYLLIKIKNIKIKIFFKNKNEIYLIKGWYNDNIERSCVDISGSESSLW